MLSDYLRNLQDSTGRLFVIFCPFVDTKDAACPGQQQQKSPQESSTGEQQTRVSGGGHVGLGRGRLLRRGCTGGCSSGQRTQIDTDDLLSIQIDPGRLTGLPIGQEGLQGRCAGTEPAKAIVSLVIGQHTVGPTFTFNEHCGAAGSLATCVDYVALHHGLAGRIGWPRRSLWLGRWL